MLFHFIIIAAFDALFRFSLSRRRASY